MINLKDTVKTSHSLSSWPVVNVCVKSVRIYIININLMFKSNYFLCHFQNWKKKWRMIWLYRHRVLQQPFVSFSVSKWIRHSQSKCIFSLLTQYEDSILRFVWKDCSFWLSACLPYILLDLGYKFLSTSIPPLKLIPNKIKMRFSVGVSWRKVSHDLH